MGNPLGPKYIPYSYMNPLGITGWEIDPRDIPNLKPQSLERRKLRPTRFRV